MGRGKGIIVGRRCPKIQTCPKCGRMRVHHSNGLYECPVPAEVTEALRAFKAENGTRWKSKLRALWMSGQDEGNLRLARNMIGPTNIDKIELPDAPYVRKMLGK